MPLKTLFKENSETNLNTSTIVASGSVYLGELPRVITTAGYRGFDFLENYVATYANDPQNEEKKNLEILQELCVTEVLVLINEVLSEDETNDFGSLMNYVVKKYFRYGAPKIVPVMGIDTEEFGYFNVVLDGCGWKEWEELSLDLFDRTGQMKGKVVVTCLKGLTE